MYHFLLAFCKTMILPCIISEIQRGFRRNHKILIPHLCFSLAIECVCSNILCEKSRLVWLSTVKGVWLCVYSHFDRSHECDGQTNGKTKRFTI